MTLNKKLTERLHDTYTPFAIAFLSALPVKPSGKGRMFLVYQGFICSPRAKDCVCRSFISHA